MRCMGVVSAARRAASFASAALRMDRRRSVAGVSSFRSAERSPLEIKDLTIERGVEAASATVFFLAVEFTARLLRLSARMNERGVFLFSRTTPVAGVSLAVATCSSREPRARCAFGRRSLPPIRKDGVRMPCAKNGVGAWFSAPWAATPPSTAVELPSDGAVAPASSLGGFVGVLLQLSGVPSFSANSGAMPSRPLSACSFVWGVRDSCDPAEPLANKARFLQLPVTMAERELVGASFDLDDGVATVRRALWADGTPACGGGVPAGVLHAFPSLLVWFRAARLLGVSVSTF